MGLNWNEELLSIARAIPIVLTCFFNDGYYKIRMVYVFYNINFSTVTVILLSSSFIIHLTLSPLVISNAETTCCGMVHFKELLWVFALLTLDVNLLVFILIYMVPVGNKSYYYYCCNNYNSSNIYI